MSKQLDYHPFVWNIRKIKTLSTEKARTQQKSEFGCAKIVGDHPLPLLKGNAS